MALGWLKNQVAAVQKGLKNEVSRYKNSEFLEAIVAGCALVAAADGDVSAPEKQKMMGFIRQSEALSAFDIDKVIEIFKKYLAKFEFDHELGAAEALAVVGRIKNKPDQARLAVRVCCAIGASDGDFDPKEQEVVKKICRDLGLDPNEFDLEG